MIVTESIGRDLMRLVIWYPVRWLAAILPVRAGLALFRGLGDVQFFLSRGKKRLVAAHLRHAVGERPGGERLETAVRQYFRNHFVNQLQIFLFPKLTRANLARFHSFEGLEHVDEALRKGRGCILIHPHFGPAQLPLCALGIMERPVMQLGLLTDEGLSFIGKNVAFRLRVKYESRMPVRMASAESFLRPVMEWVKGNNILMMTGDGAGGGRFIGKYLPVPFLNQTALFPVGGAVLSLKTGAALLPMFTLMREDGTYYSVIHGPINGAGPDPEQTVRSRTEAFARIMETYVTKSPWLWHFWDEWNDRIADPGEKERAV